MKVQLRKFALAITGFFAMLALVFGLAACGDTEVKLTMNKFETTIEEGATEQLTLTVEGAEESDAVWSSSNEQVATVEDGLVTAVAEGTATVTATIGEKEASCTVTVVNSVMPVVTADRTEVELVNGGEAITAGATVTYDGETVEAALTWTSQNTAVCTVEGGVITPVGVGETTVTVSAVYNGKTAQTTIAVEVNPDLTITASEDEINLVTYALNDGDLTQTTVDVAVLADGVPVQDAQVAVAVEGTCVTAAVEGGVLSIQAVGQGEAIITLSFTSTSGSTQTAIAVEVTRPFVQITETFTANIFDTNATLDFSEYGWADDVTGIYVGNTLISKADAPNAIDPAWLSTCVVGMEETIRIAMAQYDVLATLSLRNDYIEMTYGIPSDGNSTYAETTDEVPALADAEKIYKWTTISFDHWTTRLTTENASSVDSFDWWIFDLVLTEELTADMTFWIKTNHVVALTAGGATTMLEAGTYPGTANDHVTETCLRVFDDENNIVVGSMKVGEKYTIEINLAHKGNRVIYDFGVNQATNIYIANSRAYTAAYYNEYIAPYRNTEIEVDLTLVAEKFLPETFALDFGDVAWKNNIEGIYLDDAKISSESDVALLDSEWVQSTTVGLKQIVIKLTSGETINALLDVKASIKEVAFAVTDGNYASYAETADSVPALSGADKIYKWTTTDSNVWNTRIKTEDITQYAYWMFDFVITQELANAFTFWIGTNKAVHVGVDGVSVVGQGAINAEKAVRIFDANGKIITGSLIPNAKYTIVVDISERGTGNTYALGLGDVTNAYVANVVVCTADYYATNVEPTLDTTAITPDAQFTVERNIASTHTLDFSGKEWANKVEGIYVSSTLVSVIGSANVLDSAWVAKKPQGQSILVQIKLTEGAPVYALIDVVESAKYVPFVKVGSQGALEDSNDVVPALEGAVGMQKWTTPASDHWSTRMRVGNIGSYGYWMFDVVFAQELTNSFSIWLGTQNTVSVGLDGVSVVAQGTLDPAAAVRVFDANGKIITGTLQANVKYTVVVDLSFKGSGADYLLGINCATTAYLANVIVCTADFFNANYATQFDSTAIVATEEFTVERYVASTHALDFSGKEWENKVAGIYFLDTLVSKAENPTVLDASWIGQKPQGHTILVQIKLTEGDPVYAMINVVESAKDVVFTPEYLHSQIVASTDEVPALAGANNVYKWTTTNANVWNTHVNAGNVSTYAYWIFDLVLTEEMQNAFTLWIGTNRAVHVGVDGSLVIGDGSGFDPAAAVRIFDANGKLVVGSLQANVKYTIQVDLSLKGTGTKFAVGLGDITTAYLANAMVCTAEYYNANIAPTRNLTVTEVSEQFTVEKWGVGTHTLDFSGKSWNNMVAGIYFGDTLISVEGTPNAIQTAWIQSKAVGYKALVTIRLTEGDPISAFLNIKAESIDQYAFYVPDGGATLNAYEGDVTEIGFEAGTNVSVYNSGATANNNWNNRISANKALGSYDWWIFDIVFEDDVFTGTTDKIFVIWVASGHVVELYANGSFIVYGQSEAHDPCCIHIYNAETGAKVTGALEQGVRYTFEIQLMDGHKGSKELYEIGAYPADLTYYVANCIACSDEYYQANIASSHVEE